MATPPAGRGEPFGLCYDCLKQQKHSGNQVARHCIDCWNPKTLHRICDECLIRLDPTAFCRCHERQGLYAHPGRCLYKSEEDIPPILKCDGTYVRIRSKR